MTRLSKEQPMKRTAALILLAAAVVILLTALTMYENAKLSVRQEEVLSRAVRLSDIPLRELAALDSSIGYFLTQQDKRTTDDILRERMHLYFLHTRTLAETTAILHTLTEEKKYDELHTAMENLQSFFISLTDKQKLQITETLEKHFKLLQDISSIIRQKPRITDFTEQEALRLKELSERLLR